MKRLLTSVCLSCMTVLAQPALAVESTPLVVAFDNADFEYLNANLNGLQKKFEEGKATELELRDTFRMFSSPDPLQYQTLTQWVQRYPKSYAAHLAMGIAYQDAAYRARGRKWANETPEENFAEMCKLLRIAAEEFKKSVPLTAKPFITYYFALDLFKPSGDIKSARELVDRAEKILPHNYLVNTGFMLNLLPRWGGSNEQMLAFIEERKKDSPPSETFALEAVYYNELGQMAAKNKENRKAHDNYVEALKRAKAAGGSVRKDRLGSASYWVCNTTKEPELCPVDKAASQSGS
jgi:tetratricopeptide (TPR) repeat protein